MTNLLDETHKLFGGEINSQTNFHRTKVTVDQLSEIHSFDYKSLRTLIRTSFTYSARIKQPQATESPDGSPGVGELSA